MVTVVVGLVVLLGVVVVLVGPWGLWWWWCGVGNDGCDDVVHGMGVWEGG